MIKYPLFSLLLLLLLFACKSETDFIKLVEDQNSSYNILVSEKADSITNYAARELKNYFYKIAQVEIDIIHDKQEENKCIYVGKESITDADILSELDTLGEDAFLIKTIGDDVFIAGNDGKSNVYAVYTFIEEYLDCRLLSISEEFVPESKNIRITMPDKTYIPAFSFRRTLFPGLNDQKYRYWHKIEQLDEWGSFVHTFHRLIPPEKYYKSHPEYFSLIGGRRLSDAQLCLSNPEVINTLKENLGKEIEKKPTKKYWSVSQNDCINFCECDNCKAMYEKYVNISGAYIYMANEIARAFPDKHISTLAYQFTRSAPENIRPLENVNIMFCSIECNRSMPLASDERSKAFVKDMEDWAALTDNIFLWDYVVQFKNYLTPFPNFHVLQPNIQFFAENNVNMMFQQGSSRNWSDLSEMKQYLISKLMWDPDADADKIITDFLEKYYGPAAPFIRTYYESTHEALKAHEKEEFLNIYGFPSDYYDSYLTPELMNKYRGLMDQAEAAVKKDSMYLMRVWRARLPVDFAYLDISLNKNEGDLSFIDEKQALRQEMMQYLDRFVELSETTGITTINERNFQTSDYKKYALRKLERMTQKNKAKGKELKLLTTHSELYPVGGVNALTDGLFGDLDFNNNWLGFQGHDMIAEIDLLESQEIKSVSMNFLKAVNSWVFLPVVVTVEKSMDGVKYDKIASLKGDISDQNYLVKSIPFNFNFKPVEARYLKIKAISMKECPEWHRGYGNPSWIFIDELIVE